MKENIRMILVLTVITLLSGLVLSALYDYTAPIIAEREEEALAESIGQVLGEVTDLEEKEIDGQIYYTAKKNGDDVVAIVTTAQGYGGPVDVLVGINLSQQEVIEIQVVSHTETPGLGTIIEEERFVRHFRGLEFKDNYRDDVDIVSGATVSCMAAVQATEDAVAWVRGEILDEDVPVELTPEEKWQAFMDEFVGDEYEEFVRNELTVYKGEETIALEGSKEGYAAPVRTILAVDIVSTEVKGIEVLEQQETPGLGDPIVEEDFLSAFIGQSFEEDMRMVESDPQDGEIEILSNATISTEAVVDLVNSAFEVLRNMQSGGEI